ncbi:MAG: hypothetical protein M3Y87_18015, partial [Myxococcota bacterium]|nr:hypothetical protein [Myxococcota bacterium]
MSERGGRRSIDGARAHVLSTRVAIATIAGTLAIAAIAACSGGGCSGRSSPDTAAASAPSPASMPARVEPLPTLPVIPAAPLPDAVRWIAVGGGSEPELNQLSLEEDLLLARDVLGEGGVVLFAGGPGTRSVQVSDDVERGDPLRRELAELLSGR